MNVDYSKRFEKQARKLDQVTKKLLAKSIKEVKEADVVSDIPNCVKMSGYKNVYRIHISNHRAIFVHQVDETIFFEYVVPRGQSYDKKYHKIIKGK